ncbi:MFS transporter [Amycolatopsis rhizosphaerae]|uniref:MFS transporter n=1 Tax=Amycolatopsis rhizosphaerae TaxID=2053003 RepID=A0A558D6Y3_9PSEU|nr:MFS transporter [Amycolatopsis rhizosphaerae]TVT56767.1 MFS transporter [Amycolatopsis rhizosphaerae]
MKPGARAFFGIPGFRRLLFTRFAAQWSDGVFRAGLAGAVLFNPERGADPLTIAGGFAVLLLPYSVIGPFAGALLDRWDRRRVLVLANLLRGVAVVATATAVGFGLAGPVLFVLALLVEGISRFVGSGMSASLPHVVRPETIVAGNALAATLGSMVAVVGGACAIGLRAALGTGNTGSAWTTSIAILGSALAALIAARFARGKLGPDLVDEPSDALVAVAHGLADGGRAALSAPTVTAGFVALFAHRASYGISLLLTVLLMRFSFHDAGPLKSGLPGLGQMAGMAGAGILLAGFLTPRLVQRFGRHRVVFGSLLLAALAQAGLGLPMLLPTVLLASFCITAAGQVLKLCVDSAVQSDIGDEARGRVFALYDTLFNITQVVAVAAAAAITPLDGHSIPLLLAATAIYLLGGLGYFLAIRRNPGI